MPREQLSGHTVFLRRIAQPGCGTETPLAGATAAGATAAGVAAAAAERMDGISWDIIKVDQATRQVTLLSRPNNAVQAMNLDTLLRLVREGVLQID